MILQEPVYAARLQLPINRKTRLLEQHLLPQNEVSNWNHHQDTSIERGIGFLVPPTGMQLRYLLPLYAVMVAPI